MNIADSFARWFEEEFLFTLGTDLFIGSVPLKAPDPCVWIVSSGGFPISRGASGERFKEYTLNVYYRSTSAKDVYDILQDIEIKVNSANCVQLDDFDTIEVSATVFPTDQDLDLEDRTVGLVSITARVYR